MGENEGGREGEMLHTVHVCTCMFIHVPLHL